MWLVNGKHQFYPPQRTGRIVHLGMIALLIIGAVLGLWSITRAQVGPTFLLYLLPTLVALVAGPYLIYRLYTLQHAVYTLERDQVRLQWGWRVEVIPTPEIRWIRPAADLRVPLPLPRLRWPGAFLGSRRMPDGTPVEFMASQKKNILLVNCQERMFAISPRDTEAFLRAYQRVVEMGSINPAEPESIRPSFLLARLWQTTSARYLVLIGFLLGLGLLVWISLRIPGLGQVSLGFTPTGAPREPLPAIQLMLLPVLNAIVYFVNGSLGLFFFRRKETYPWAYLLWSVSVLVATLFLFSTYFILRAS